MRHAVCVLLLLSCAALHAQAPAPGGAERIHAQFLELIQKRVEAEMKGLPPEQIEAAAKQMGATKEELPAKMAAKMLEEHGPYFRVTEAQAQAMLAGNFDDEANAKTVRADLKIFKDLEVPLPRLLVVQIESFSTGKLKGLELEFFARHCAALRERAKQALEKK
ncbi:MAG: hypothetical protein HS116_24200 [Planctomycetes bacterium]|nr:hypothetical protein [Planctomycetota bacterium]